MAHRARLNVVVNTFGKMPADLFTEFEGKQAQELSAGDVKYHQGFSSDVVTPGGPMHLTLAFNPSHLEAVDPVVAGSVRARHHRRGDEAGGQVLPVLIHGDAALAGQGVIQEILNMAKTRGEMIFNSKPILRTINSINPRVFIKTPRAAAFRQRSPTQRPAIILTIWI